MTAPTQSAPPSRPATARYPLGESEIERLRKLLPRLVLTGPERWGLESICSMAKDALKSSRSETATINERGGLGAATEPSRRADAKAPTAEAVPSLPCVAVAWVSVKERLPDTDRDVLVCARPLLEDQDFVYISQYEKPEHDYINGWGIGKVSYWAELPSPPERDSR